MSPLERYLSCFVSRRDDFALQRPDGGYVRAGRPLLAHEVAAHLAGKQTIGSYVIDEGGYCQYAVFDADSVDGLLLLRKLQARLALAGIASYLERSRRGAHLWVFFTGPVLASRVRSWLLPFCPAGVEFYPKQNEGRGYGSLVRLPFGIHRKSGKRYPFLTWTDGGPAPVATSLHAALSWLSTVQRVPVLARVQAQPTHPTGTPKHTSFSLFRAAGTHTPIQTIREWCAQHDPFTFIGRYVDLDGQGVGCCPFGWHHAHGQDRHASFKVYTPGVPGGYCWYCHAWQQGGSLFDFLRYYRNLDAHTLWRELREEVQA